VQQQIRQQRLGACRLQWRQPLAPQTQLHSAEHAHEQRRLSVMAGIGSQFLEHRASPTLLAHTPVSHRLRQRARLTVEAEIHPDATAARAITAGDRVRIANPNGAVRARERLNSALAREACAASTGWWQGCAELGLAGYPPYGPDTANLNLILRETPGDPVSGSAPLRASLWRSSALKPRTQPPRVSRARSNERASADHLALLAR